MEYLLHTSCDTIRGRPNAIYSWPVSHGGLSGLIVNVPENELAYASDYLIEIEEGNEYENYFNYVMNALDLHQPGNWREALELY